MAKMASVWFIEPNRNHWNQIKPSFTGGVSLLGQMDFREGKNHTSACGTTVEVLQFSKLTKDFKVLH